MKNKSIIFSTSCACIHDYADRTLEWLSYYKELLCGENIDFLIVNDGPAYGVFDNKCEHIIEFPNHLGRINVNCFPGWKRSFYSGLAFCHKNYEYVAHLESDCYIKDKDEFLRHFYSGGYYCGFTPTYNMIESALQILNDVGVREGLLSRYTYPDSWREEINFEEMLRANYNPRIIMNGDRIEGKLERIKDCYNYLSGVRHNMLKVKECRNM